MTLFKDAGARIRACTTRTRLRPASALALLIAVISLPSTAMGERLAPPKAKAFTLTGKAAVKGKLLHLGDGGGASVRVTVPEAPAIDGLKPAAWMLRIRIDAQALDGEPTFTVTRDDSANGSNKPRARGSMTLADVRGKKGSTSYTKLAMGSLALEGGTFDLAFECASGTVQVDAIYVERYHARPTRKMIGKANGHLGPDQLACGALGLTGLTEHQCTAFSVLAVQDGGPAAEANIQPGDLITGVAGAPFGPSSIAPGWDWFESSHEARIGRAIEAALLKGESSIELEVASPTAPPRSVEVELRYGTTGAEALEGFPLAGPLGDRLRADMLRWTLKNQRKNGSWPGAPEVTPGLAGLALLGTKDDAHLAAVKRAVNFLMQKYPKPTEMKGLAFWAVGFQGSMFCEYYLRTGDKTVLPWIEEAATWLPTTTHECKWGMQAFGHGPDGLPYDNKALMAPAAHLLLFDALARQCGVESKVWEHIEPYVRHSWSNPEDGGHGAMGYNASYRDENEFWSRTGLVALAETLRARAGTPTKEALTPFLCVLMEERHPWMLNSHAYGEPGAALGLTSLAVVKPKAFDAILPQWRWRFLCSWQPGYGMRYTTPHMGAPYLGDECIVNLAYLLLMSTTHNGLAMTTVTD